MSVNERPRKLLFTVTASIFAIDRHGFHADWSVDILLDEPCGPVDYRCEDGPFLVSTSCMTISIPGSFSSGEIGVNSGSRS
jgi:hypothetical protein